MVLAFRFPSGVPGGYSSMIFTKDDYRSTVLGYWRVLRVLDLSQKEKSRRESSRSVVPKMGVYHREYKSDNLWCAKDVGSLRSVICDLISALLKNLKTRFSNSLVLGIKTDFSGS
ncbi:hypothetical protein CEXT_487611 [Caerostris extrusa]|uniref:Uncharacterized protein n=1 Tax=Caerostris extrusa TaxID=172846 RepID=A0AAV4Q724_CAEEX|nr:hypothetical protein CEXT_487611 [Caerostris extrusa]